MREGRRRERRKEKRERESYKEGWGRIGSAKCREIKLRPVTLLGIIMSSSF